MSLLDLPVPPEWMDRGLCAQTDPEAFFPDKGGSNSAAKRVCGACPVKTECLTYAVDNRELHGIWGGVGERKRRKLLPTNPDAPTHCVNGHAFTPSNTYITPSSGYRRCRTCLAANSRRCAHNRTTRTSKDTAA